MTTFPLCRTDKTVVACILPIKSLSLFNSLLPPFLLPNPKSEYRAKRPARTNPKQIQISNDRIFETCLVHSFRISNFVHSKLFRISDFVLRIWNYYPLSKNQYVSAY